MASGRAERSAEACQEGVPLPCCNIARYTDDMERMKNYYTRCVEYKALTICGKQLKCNPSA